MDKRFYQDALDVQNACNGRAVINSLSRLMAEIKKETTLPIEHPALILYVDKLADLCGARGMPDAYDHIETLVELLAIVKEHLLNKNHVANLPDGMSQPFQMGTMEFNNHILIRTIIHLLYKEVKLEPCMGIVTKAYESCEKLSKEDTRVEIPR